MIKAVIWDMGGIFHRYYTEAMIDVGLERGWPVERIPLGPTGFVPDADYAAMAAGDVAEHEYLRRVLARLAAEGIEFDPVTGHDWSTELRPSTWAAIVHLDESPLFQAILTNDATRWMGERWWETWDRVHHFDAIVDVATLEHRKPQPEPYLEAVRRTGFAPDECIFVDDMPVNCRGAEAVGLQSQWFDIVHPEESVAALLARVGESALTAAGMEAAIRAYFDACERGRSRGASRRSSPTTPCTTSRRGCTAGRSSGLGSSPSAGSAPSRRSGRSGRSTMSSPIRPPDGR